MNSPDPFSDAMRAWSTMASGLSQGQRFAPSPVDPLLVQAHIASSTALLRSGQRAAQSWMEYTMAAASSTDPATRVDAARAHLRRLAEISADEARLLEQQMRALDERARALVTPAETADAPVRRAKAKP